MDFSITDENGITYRWDADFADLLVTPIDNKTNHQILTPEVNTFISMLVTIIKNNNSDIFKGLHCNREFIDYEQM